MGQQKDIIELERYALRSGIPYYSSSAPKYYIPGIAESELPSRYVIFDLSMYYQGLYFIFYDSTTGFRHSGGYSYCGLFKEIPDCKHSVTINRRDLIDRLSFKKRYLLGNKKLDKYLNVSTSAYSIDDKIFSRKRLEDYYNLSKEINYLIFKSEPDSPNILPQLNKRDLVSLTTTIWLTDLEKLNTFIRKGSIFISEI